MTDYVISRKRSRPSGTYAIDPCLGYYVLQPHNSLAKSLNHSQRQHTSGRTENREENNVAFLYDNYTIPSLLPEELELESPRTERFLDFNYENTTLLEATDWIELVPSRTKAAPGLVIPESDSTTVHAQNLSQTSDVLTEEPHPLTVEEFLKRPKRPKSKARKTYRVKNVRSLKETTIKIAEPTKIGDNGQCDDGHKVDALELRSRNIPRATPSEDDPCDVGSSSPEHESSSICDTPKITGPGGAKTKRRKSPKPLKARIYEAAVATHVDPEDNFAQDEVDPTRPPLRFVPGPAKDALRKRKTKNWTLVDPRKSKSICTASFASGLQRAPRRVSNDDFASLSHTLDRLPMENWKWGAGQEIPQPFTTNSRPSIKIVNHIAPQNRAISIESVLPSYPPLMFIPPTEADSNYAALFRRKRWSRDQVQPHVLMTTPLFREMTNNDKKAASKKRKQEPLCPSSLQFTPLTDRPTERTHSSKRSKKTTAESPMLTMIPIPNSTTPIRSRPVSSPALKDVNYPSTSRGEVVQESRELSSPIEPTLPIRTPVPIESLAITPSILPFPTQKTTMSPNRSSVLGTQRLLSPLISRKRTLPNKPLRTLESFMDEFLENIRNVQGQILEGKSKDKHPRPSKVTREPSRGPCVGGNYYYEEGCDMVQSSLLSKAITSGAIKSGTPLENSLSFDSQLSGWSTPNAAETLERCPSPDILSLLEPRNYQVVLGSR